MVKRILNDYCQTCNIELIEKVSVKLNWRKPLCFKCREILLNYHLKKDLIDRIMKSRAIKLRELNVT